MKKGWFIAGGIFVFINCIYLLSGFIEGLSSSNLSWTENIFYILSVLFFIGFIILGIYFLRIGFRGLKQSKILNVGLIISLIGFGFVVLGGIMLIFGLISNPSEQPGVIVPLLMGLLLFSIFNVVTSILITIHYFKGRSSKN